MSGLVGMSELRHAPEVSLESEGVVSKQTIERVDVFGCAALLRRAETTGFTVLWIGPVGTPSFPDINGSSIELDADACRHLARLLDAKADEISAHLASDQEGVS